MAAKLKISADTSEVKKSLLDLGKSFKDVKTSKVSIFTAEDKRFLKNEMKKEISLMKSKLKENRDEIAKMVAEQKKMVAGSQEELEMRKKIIESYKVQARLGKQLGQVQKDSKSIPGGGAGGMMDKVLSGGMSMAAMLPKLLGVGALATAGLGVMRGIQGTAQYNAGISNRTKMQGLGMDDNSIGGGAALARVGLTEQDMIERRIEAAKTLGREGTNNDIEMRKAGFERAYGLDGGTMTNVASSFRGQVGGAGATDIQMKLQASVMAAGIEDAIGPYLDSAVSLLTSINETGTANTTEMIGVLAQMAKDGERTPEQLAKNFMGVNSSIKGASGDASAFLQTAFGKAGIGGGTVGGTKFSMSSGGLMGLDRKSLEKRGYNPELLNQMDKTGMFSGVGDRANAIMNQFRESGGLKQGERVSGIKDMNRMVGMGNLANNVFGTKGEQGFDLLMMLEKVQDKKMSQKQFDAKLKEMQEGKDPSIARLDKINSTLAGQTEVLNMINSNLLEGLGKQGIRAQNVMTKGDNAVIEGATNLAGAVNATGATDAVGRGVEESGKWMNGKLGEKAYDWMFGARDQAKLDAITSPEAMNKKRRELVKSNNPHYSEEQITEHIRKKDIQNGNFPTAKEIGKEVANALRTSPISVKSSIKNQVTLPDGNVTERTNK